MNVCIFSRSIDAAGVLSAGLAYFDAVGEQVSFKSFHQGLGSEGFCDITSGSGHAAADLIKKSVLTRDHNDGQVLAGGIRTNLLADLIAVHSRHRDVQQDEIGHTFLEFGQRVNTIDSGKRLCAPIFLVCPRSAF